MLEEDDEAGEESQFNIKEMAKAPSLWFKQCVTYHVTACHTTSERRRVAAKGGGGGWPRRPPARPPPSLSLWAKAQAARVALLSAPLPSLANTPYGTLG